MFVLEKMSAPKKGDILIIKVDMKSPPEVMRQNAEKTLAVLKNHMEIFKVSFSVLFLPADFSLLKVDKKTGKPEGAYEPSDFMQMLEDDLGATG